MKEHVHTGPNRTGKKTKMIDENETEKFAAMVPPSSEGDGKDILRLRTLYAQQAHGPIGTVPPPASVKGVMNTMMQKALGREPNLLLDKLGARLAFERTGTRLYDGLIGKLEAYGSWDGGPTLADLTQIRAEEHQHMQLVWDAIEKLGADPTAQTPSADQEAVMSLGLVQVVSDPRTTLSECMDAAVVAELTDNACWDNLIVLCNAFGQKALVEQFEVARVEEERHLVLVKAWLRERLVGVAKKVD
jgi:hypothetical protein